ncbi:MAG TPA: hypothetical protein VIU12_16500 [Chryseolinea sp.]
MNDVDKVWGQSNAVISSDTRARRKEMDGYVLRGGKEFLLVSHQQKAVCVI